MSRRNLPRLMLVAILASLLTLAGPAQAQAAELPHPEKIRLWLVSLWETGVSTLLPWYKTGHASEPRQRHTDRRHQPGERRYWCHSRAEAGHMAMSGPDLTQTAEPLRVSPRRPGFVGAALVAALPPRGSLRAATRAAPTQAPQPALTRPWLH